MYKSVTTIGNILICIVQYSTNDDNNGLLICIVQYSANDDNNDPNIERLNNIYLSVK